MNKVVLSDTPHIRKKRTTKHIMLDVLIALVPVIIAGLVYFGYRTAFLILISTATAVASEFAYLLIRKKTIKEILRNFDYTSAVTGVLLALTLPPACPWYIPFLGSIFAVVVVKMLFGGTGKNIVNPASTARVFAFIAFQSIMVTGWLAPNFSSLNGNGLVSGATVLNTLLTTGASTVPLSNLDLFLGMGVTGSVGETCKLAVLIGGLYLIVRKVIHWEYPMLILASCGLVSVMLNRFSFDMFLPSILSGGVFLGAFFMATDYVTAPSARSVRIIYYVILGAVVALLRFATKIEVVSFGLLLMNLLVPLFNKWIRPRPFGAPSFNERFARLTARRQK